MSTNPLARTPRDAQSLMGAALTYAGYGWPVFPAHGIATSGWCTCGDGACGPTGKHPRTRDGLKSATKNHDQIERWWKRWPRSNIAIRTGAESGLVIVDVDPDHGGLASLRELIRQYNVLPITMTVGTGSDGLHFYFRHPGGTVRNSAGAKLGPGLDVRGDGGYVIAPPSRHYLGRRYHWITETDLAPLPDWLHRRLVEVPRQRREVDLGVHTPDKWATAALAGELRAITNAPEGIRNHTLNRAAFNLGQIVGGGSLDRSSTEYRLVQAAVAIGLTERESRATVTSGLDAGIGTPRRPATREPLRPAESASRSEIEVPSHF